MLQLVKKRRPGWAVLALAALVASVLVAGAVPAAAVTGRADHTTRLSVCVGDAAADLMFTDVSEGHVFRTAINCIAYYGITKGTGDGSTYSPNQDVTRAQMAVFIARAADVAGVDLDDVSDAGFSDIDGGWREAQNAINRLASNGVIPRGGAFRPDDAITRAEMATFLIGLLDNATREVTVGTAGRVLLTRGSVTAEADDYFADSRTRVSDPATRSAINALYELGVTKGTGPTPLTGDAQPGLDLFYSPDDTVDRGQMAAFITRALAHIGLRPRGVSAQYDGADVVVSVRDAQLRPISGAAVDVFWATTADAGRAFAADRTCGEVVRDDHSASVCAIDESDPVTGSDGEARVAVTALRRIPEGGATVWAWTGRFDETVSRATELYRLDVAEGADIGLASETLVTTTFSASMARLGSSVGYTLQLRDIVGNVTTGVDGTFPAQWTLAVRTVDGNGRAKNLPAQRLESDNSGEETFTVRVDDPDPDTVGDQVTATYTLSAADNAPPDYATVDAAGGPATTGTVVFSDLPGSIAEATATIETRDYFFFQVVGRSAHNVATVTVLDQYGARIPGAKVKLESDNSNSSVTDQEFAVDSRGSHRFSYEYRGQGGETEMLSAFYGLDSTDRSGDTATVHWAVDAEQSGRGNVLAGDVPRRQIVVDDGDGPVIVVYDDNDRFNLHGVPTTMAAFEAEFAAALRLASPGLQLAWSRYSAGSARPVSEYTLS